MTERQKDERDLTILAQYEVGVSKAELMRRHSVSKSYVYKLIKEALDGDEPTHWMPIPEMPK